MHSMQASSCTLCRYLPVLPVWRVVGSAGVHASVTTTTHGLIVQWVSGPRCHDYTAAMRARTCHLAHPSTLERPVQRWPVAPHALVISGLSPTLTKPSMRTLIAHIDQALRPLFLPEYALAIDTLSVTPVVLTVVAVATLPSLLDEHVSPTLTRLHMANTTIYQPGRRSVVMPGLRMERMAVVMRCPSLLLQLACSSRKFCGS
jgi:hypothetical protein